MPKNRQEKEQSVTAVAEKLATMKAVVFANYDGLTVNENTELRRMLRTESIDLIMAKKTLLRRALEVSHLDPAIVDTLDGGIALAFGYADEVLPAKLLQKYTQAHPAIKLVGGIVDGAFFPAEQIIALAKLPGREELIAKTIWTIKGPLTGLVNVMAGNLRGLVNVLQALKDKQPATAG